MGYRTLFPRRIECDTTTRHLNLNQELEWWYHPLYQDMYRGSTLELYINCWQWIIYIYRFRPRNKEQYPLWLRGIQ